MCSWWTSQELPAKPDLRAGDPRVPQECRTGLQPVICTPTLLTGKSFLMALPTPCRNNDLCQKGY